uniref:Fungal lipase-like domain-containing protein n=1 Tax=Panagrolaimus sp. PS1159 TaxID=55785 RepID=A0AC35G4E2_9BILA
MPLAAAAYSDDPNPCISNIISYWSIEETGEFKPSVFGQYTAFRESFNDTCSGLIILDKKPQSITVVFRGTPNYEEFFEHNFNFNEMVPFGAGGKVSKQMFDGFNKIWLDAGMKNDFLTLKNKYPDYRYNFVGHSLGGAMASLAVATIVSTGILPSRNVDLTTFGEPRVGDKAFANVLNTIARQPNGNINSLRVVHNHDIIPHFPPLNSTPYFQHIRELWYPNDMTTADYIDCPYHGYDGGEDATCSDSIPFKDLKGNEHKFYYNREVSVYGINGCQDLVTTGNVPMATI